MAKKSSKKTKTKTGAKTKTKTGATTTTGTGPNAMNNWHRKMYGLDQQASDATLYTAVVSAGAKNEFWLEPAVYTGPPTTVVLIPVVPNSLCFRIGFVGQDMHELWRACEFFAAGTKDLTFKPDGTPAPDQDTQRLQSKAVVQNKPAFISLYLDPNVAGKVHVNVVFDPSVGGGGGGWGGGHTFVRPPP